MAKKIVPLNREPVYRDLQRELKKRIHQGHWRKGALIPSRRALADEFQVSVPTVQKAVANMVAEGILRVNAKRGTYVFGDPDPEAHLAAEVASTYRPLDDPAMAGEIGGHVSLVADIRPGSFSLFASGWPFVIVHEAEFALAQYGIQSRFANRFDTQRKLGMGEFLSAEEDAAVSRALLEAILKEKPAAVIVHESVVLASDRALLRQITDSGIHTIMVGSSSYGPEFVSITYDSTNAGYQAAEHMIKQGCRRLLFFSAYQADWVEMRAAGVRLAVEAAGLPADTLQEVIAPAGVDDVFCENDGPHRHATVAHNYARKMLAEGLGFDGVIAVNDGTALGFIRAAGEQGLQVGVDYTIAGFDDSPESQSMGLTTMHPPCASIGREAARVVARVLRGQDDLSSVILKSRLVVRSSSSRVPNAK